MAKTSDMDVATPVDFTYAVYRESRTLSGEDKSALFDMAGLLKKGSPQKTHISITCNKKVSPKRCFGETFSIPDLPVPAEPGSLYPPGR